jgi:sec-independent protein translocase protein TatB
MLDVGFSEILLTSAIALIVLGPERLPKVARQVGNWMGRARVMARQLSEQLEREVSAEELLKTQKKALPKPEPNSIAPGNGAGPPRNAASGATSYTPDGAPAPVAAPATGSEAPGEAPPAASGDPMPVVSPVEPVYGLAAALTTPAAMHAHDTEPRTAESQAATTDHKSSP